MYVSGKFLYNPITHTVFMIQCTLVSHDLPHFADDSGHAPHQVASSAGDQFVSQVPFVEQMSE